MAGGWKGKEKEGKARQGEGNGKGACQKQITCTKIIEAANPRNFVIINDDDEGEKKSGKMEPFVVLFVTKAETRLICNVICLSRSSSVC